MRRTLTFDIDGSLCHATLDLPDADIAPRTGLLIVSGGNEIRAGAHRGMALLAQAMAAGGHAVWRFDRRGIGDSAGDNAGFAGSARDLDDALAAFHAAVPSLAHVAAFGNCDAASAIVLHLDEHDIAARILANPWTHDPAAITTKAEDPAPVHSPASVRAHYAARLRDPAQWLRVLRGGVNLRKLIGGLRTARSRAPQSDLAAALATRLDRGACPTVILLAARDNTAAEFARCWQTAAFARARQHTPVHALDSASHGFADPADRAWLHGAVLQQLQAIDNS